MIIKAKAIIQEFPLLATIAIIQSYHVRKAVKILKSGPKIQMAVNVFNSALLEEVDEKYSTKNSEEIAQQ